MSAARSAVERAGVYGHAAVRAFGFDDWKALTDAHSSTLQRVESGADLLGDSEGKVAEIAAHAAVKVGEITAAHLTASGFELAGAAAAAIVAARDSGRLRTKTERSPRTTMRIRAAARRSTKIKRRSCGSTSISKVKPVRRAASP